MQDARRREYNGAYTGEFLNRVAFPLGGIGAGMMCLEGTAALSHVSLRHRPEVFHEPALSSAVTITGYATVGVQHGQPFVTVRSGEIDIARIEYQPLGSQ